LSPPFVGVVTHDSRSSQQADVVPFEIQAHRGNDAATLRRLLSAGPSSVEVDVGIDADGVVVAPHDANLSDASGLTLAAALALAGSAAVSVEAKCFLLLTPAPREFARALAPFLRGIALASFDERVLAEARRLCWSTPTTFLFRQPLRIATGASTLGPRHDLVTHELVHAAHSLDLRVVPWTVDHAPEMARLIELGVDGLGTDDPALARACPRSLCGPRLARRLDG